MRWAPAASLTAARKAAPCSRAPAGSVSSARANRRDCSCASSSASAWPASVAKQQPLAAVGEAGPLLDVILVEQLLQHAAEALLGDFQEVEQFGHRKARAAVDEIQHAMMGAAEIVAQQQPVGVADEIAIGEKQGLDQVEHRLGAARLRRARGKARRRLLRCKASSMRLSRFLAAKYVSSIDIFQVDCYSSSFPRAANVSAQACLSSRRRQDLRSRQFAGARHVRFAFRPA